MKKFIILSITAVFAVGFLFVTADSFAASSRISKVTAVKVAQKATVSKSQTRIVSTPVRTLVSARQPITRPKPIPTPRPRPNYERLRIATPKPDETINNTFTISGSAWRWFEGNIPTKVYDYNNTLLYDGFITASPISFSAPTYFSKTVTLTKQPTTDAGTIEFNDYSAKDGRLAYQKVMPVRFASFNARPVITLLSPNGGEIYRIGQPVTVNWKISGTVPTDWDKNSRGIPDVSIALYRNDNFVQFLTQRNTGGPILYMKVPSNLAAGNNYKVKIASLGTNGASGRYSDFSDAPFTITLPSPRYVAQPTNLILGKTYEFKFIATAQPFAEVLLYLQRPDGTMQYNGVTGDIIAKNLGKPIPPGSWWRRTDETGIWAFADTWQLPRVEQTGTWVSWVSVGGAVSNKVYHQVTASSQTKQSSITVLSPNGGEQWERGKTYDIKWISSGIAASNNVQIEISGINIYRKFIANIPGSSGVYHWTIPNNLISSDQYSVSVTCYLCYDANNNQVVADSSNAPFSIILPPTPIPTPTSTPFYLAFNNGSLVDNLGRQPLQSNTTGISYVNVNDIRGQAAKFGNSGSFAEYSCSGAFNKSQGTVGALVKFDKFTAHDAVIWQTNDSRFALYYDYASDNSEKRITARAGGENSAAQFRFDQNYGQVRNRLAAGEWHYIVMTWSGAPQGTVKIYIDGELKDTASYSAAQSCSSFRVGNNYWPGLNFGDGWLDELSVRPTALSAEDIKRLYDGYNLRPALTPALTVALAADNPIANTILPAQIKIPFTAIKLTSAADGPVTVYGLTIDSDNPQSPNFLYNIRAYKDGVQIASGKNLELAFERRGYLDLKFYNPIVLSAGTSISITIWADRTDLAQGDIRFNVLNVETNIQAKSITGLPVYGNYMTLVPIVVNTAKIVVSKNAAFANSSAVLPNGAAGAANVRIGSFIISTPAGEAVDVTSIVIKDASTIVQLGDNFQNLKLMNGNTQIGPIIGSLAVSGPIATYAFTPPPSVRIPASTKYVVDVYADIKSTPPDAGTVFMPVAFVDAVTAVGATSGLDVSSTDDLALQDAYISANGSLTLTLAPDTPTAQQLVMGATNQTVAKFKLSAGADEDIAISAIYLNGFFVALNLASQATSTFSNIKLYNGATQVGAAANFSFNSAGTYAVASFTGLNLVVPRNSSVTLTVKTDVNRMGSAASGTVVISAILPDYDSDSAGIQESIVARGVSSGATISGNSLDFGTAGSNDDAAVSGNQMTVVAN